MHMRSKWLIVGVGAVILMVIVAVPFFSLKITRQTIPVPDADVSPTMQPLGGDADEHGCIGSAGYSWCEAKQKCLRTWEESCTQMNKEEEVRTAVRAQLIAKHGPDAEALNISVAIIDGGYAKGGTSVEGMGGGMWFASEVNGMWQLVWDGNGIIECSDLEAYPEFPSTLIPECYDSLTQQMMTR